MTTTDWEDRQMFGTGDLARFLGGSEDSFTGLLLVLITKAQSTPENYSRLKFAFPREVRAWETWNSMSPVPTFRELREALQEQDAEKVMSNQTRTIARDQLEEWGLPHDLAEEQDAAQWPGIAVEIHREQTDTRRWYSRHLLVFKAPDDGQPWGVTYNQGLTEIQEDTDPWDDAAEVTAHRMEQYEKTVTAWRKVGAADEPGGA